MKTKKSFKNPSANPAMQFITPQQNEAPPSGVPMKLNPLYIETKSKRLNLIMQPSLHTKLKKAAATQGRSLNDFIHNTLAAAVEA
ncbi:MAG: type II toxin-antitoxin system HicB family antitoxin [Chitinispirillia bacterium]|nr:type II toxin-antitoxin system HicB family antitoxin [Chitinispirillia bacterium]